MKKTGEKIIDFYSKLEFKGAIPQGISIMNPYRENPDIIPLISRFYLKFYNDSFPRHMILGINPGRFGAGVTGLPFTDTRRLIEKCGLSIEGIATFETSSAFVYEMIDQYGGPEKFYSEFFISAVSPLGFVSPGKKGKMVNFNYYDSRKLSAAIYDFIVETIEEQLDFGIVRDLCFCLGTGENFRFLQELNHKHKFFGDVVPLEHPRYIMQYKTRHKQEFINKYLNAFRQVRTNFHEL